MSDEDDLVKAIEEAKSEGEAIEIEEAAIEDTDNSPREEDEGPEFTDANA